jgi:hypothetical protein
MASTKKSLHPLTQFIRNCAQIESLRKRNAQLAEESGYSVEKLEALWQKWKESGQKEVFAAFCEREKQEDKATTEEINALARQSPEQWKQVLESDASRRFLRALGCISVKEGIFQLRKFSNLAKVVSLGDGGN